jgi:hypothetical protein
MHIALGSGEDKSREHLKDSAIKPGLSCFLKRVVHHEKRVSLIKGNSGMPRSDILEEKVLDRKEKTVIINLFDNREDIGE